MKKQIAVAVLSAALLAAAVYPASTFAASTFQDIAHSKYRTQIEALQEAGIVKGVSKTEFQPEEQLTAGQGVSLIVKTTEISLAAISFKKAPTADGFYTRVKNDAWYADSFIIAHYNGLDIPKDIDPNAAITREQFTHYLVQAIEKTGQYPLIKMYISISDEQDIETSYQGTVQRALLYKLASLDKDGRFHPQQVLTREEAADMLYKANEFIQSHRDNAPVSPVDEGQLFE
ncbi:S-layer homology domain-containing protein [Paenibacillus sp. NPDC058071]|uniref:S-layer homology domain-containing protein n=1 Tax=Paenibacillus sp. NPDC058071 TaxID=3346326 RepID=UPI0036DDB86E